MPTPFAPPPLTPPPASSWARVRGTPAGGGEGLSERWRERSSPHLSRSLLPSGEVQERFGCTSSERGMAPRVWGKQSSPHFSRSLLPRGEIQEHFGRTSSERNMALRVWGKQSSPHLSRHLSPFGGIQEPYGWMSGERGMAFGWEKQSSPHLSRHLSPFGEIQEGYGRTSGDRVMAFGWIKQISPHFQTFRPSLRPRFHQSLSVSSEGGFSPNVTGETFLSRLGGSHFRLPHPLARPFILSPVRGLKFEGWGEQGSPHPSKDSSPPPGRCADFPGSLSPGGGVRGGGSAEPLHRSGSS